MLTLLRRLVEAESPSHVPIAQQTVQARLAEELVELDYRVRYLPGKETGGHLLARPQRSRRTCPYQLLLGHSDTVWPQGTLKNMPISDSGERFSGPGSYDMKAGLVITLYALRAIKELGLQPPCSPVVFINSDEEIGSPESTRPIRHLARHARRALVMEPSLGPQGHLKTARKGVGGFRVQIEG